MTPFTLFAPAKINLALHVLGRRADGYHDLDSIVAFANVGDELTFSPAPAFSVTAEGPFAADLPAAPGNIITRAHAAVIEIAKARGKSLPPVAVHLLKNLPVASGIGGGSSNAAAAMRGFLKIVEIESLDNEIMAAALRLGADVPVCLLGKACRMQGVGERLTPLPYFSPLHAILVNPLVSVPTPAVFDQLGLQRGQGFGQPITGLADPACWRNDLAASAIVLAPVISDVLKYLESLPGTARAFMSGSGATCVKLFDSNHAAELPDHGWWCRMAILT